MKVTELSNQQLSDFLKQWGLAFKELDGDYAQSCYEACVDAHNAINDKPLKFFLDKGRLSKFIQEIASELESQIKQKRLSSEYQIRVDCFNHISQKILEPKVVQNSLF